MSAVGARRTFLPMGRKPRKPIPATISRILAMALARSPVDPDGRQWHVRLVRQPHWHSPTRDQTPATAGGTLFRRLWTIEATSDAGDHFTSHAVGLKKALRRRAMVSYFLSRGLRPEPVQAVPPSGDAPSAQSARSVIRDPDAAKPEPLPSRNVIEKES